MTTPVLPLSDGQLLTMLQEIYPDCRLTTATVSRRRAPETVPLLEFHLTTESVIDAFARQKIYYDYPGDQVSPLEPLWSVWPDEVQALAADLDDDGTTEIAIAFREFARGKGLRDAGWHQLAVFGVRNGRPQLLGFRKIDRLTGRWATIHRFEAVDFGRCKGLFYRYSLSRGISSDRTIDESVEIYFLERGRLQRVFDEDLGRFYGGSAYAQYSMVPRAVEFHDLNNDGMAEVVFLDSPARAHQWTMETPELRCADLIVNHVPRVFGFDGERFSEEPDFFSTTETLHWQCLSVSPTHRYGFPDANNRIRYCRLEEKALALFGGAIHDWNAFGDVPAALWDRLHIRAGGDDRPLLALVLRSASGQERTVEFGLVDYRKAKILRAAPDEMDYAWELDAPWAPLRLRRRARVLKVVEGISGLAILEETFCEKRDGTAPGVNIVREQLATNGAFHAFDAVALAPALVCTNAKPKEHALVLVKTYVGPATVRFLFPEGQASGGADRVTVESNLGRRLWYHDRPICEALYIAPVVDTRNDSWRDEVYAYIGMAVGGLRHTRAKEWSEP